jgi:hypothetical protein
MPATAPAGAAREFRSASSILRCDFVRGREAFLCEIEISDTADYLVSFVPNEDMAAGVVECFENGFEAFGRYAEVAWYLRQAGFAVGTSQSPALTTTEAGG